MRKFHRPEKLEKSRHLHMPAAQYASGEKIKEFLNKNLYIIVQINKQIPTLRVLQSTVYMDHMPLLHTPVSRRTDKEQKRGIITLSQNYIICICFK